MTSSNDHSFWRVTLQRNRSAATAIRIEPAASFSLAESSLVIPRRESLILYPQLVKRGDTLNGE
jgi:hypothetical protein